VLQGHLRHCVNAAYVTCQLITRTVL